MSTASYRITVEDLIAAQRLHFRRQGWKMGHSMVLLGAAFGALKLLFGDDPGKIPIAAFLAVTPALFISILFAAFYVIIIPRSARRVHRQTRPWQETQEIFFDDSGIRFSSNSGEQRYAWSDFIRIVSDELVICIYVNDTCLQIVPIRALQEDQVAEILSHRR